MYSFEYSETNLFAWFGFSKSAGTTWTLLFSEYKNERIIIHRAKINALPASDPGKIIKADKKEFLVSGIDQCVEIKELARQNKKRMAYKSFYNGSKDFFNSDESFK